MTRFNFDAVRSLAVAGFATAYTTLMLFAATGTNAAELGRLVI